MTKSQLAKVLQYQKSSLDFVFNAVRNMGKMDIEIDGVTYRNGKAISIDGLSGKEEFEQLKIINGEAEEVPTNPF